MLSALLQSSNLRQKPVLCKQAPITPCVILQAHCFEASTYNNVSSKQATIALCINASAHCYKFKITLMQVSGNKVLVLLQLKLHHEEIRRQHSKSNSVPFATHNTNILLNSALI